MAKIAKREFRQNRYDEGLKRKIARQYLAGEASYRVLAEDYNLKNKDVVKEFVRWYRRILEKENDLMKKKVKVKEAKQSCNIPDYDKEKEELLKLLEYERIRNEILETLISEANKELQINIKKNFGSKR